MGKDEEGKLPDNPAVEGVRQIREAATRLSGLGDTLAEEIEGGGEEIIEHLEHIATEINEAVADTQEHIERGKGIPTWKIETEPPPSKTDSSSNEEEGTPERGSPTSGATGSLRPTTVKADPQPSFRPTTLEVPPSPVQTEPRRRWELKRALSLRRHGR